MRTEHGGGIPESTTFAQTLSDLKQKGSNVLLVGKTSARAHDSACRRLLGDESEPRQRLYVYTAGTESCGHPPEPAVRGGSATIISQETPEGNATPAEAPASVTETVVGSQLLSTLGTEILDAIEALSDSHNLSPAELRLCFDSVTPLLRDHKSENVFRLLHMVTSRIRQEQGMGHFHLPLNRESDYVRLLEPLFDAVVEVKSDEGTLKQRWHLRDRDADSGWIEL